MKYKGNTPVSRGDEVELLNDEGKVVYLAKVRDALATQFTILIKRTLVRFYFYADEGLTWRRAE